MKITNSKKKFVYLISPNKIKPKFFSDLERVLSKRKTEFFQLRLKNTSIQRKIYFGKKIKKICKKYNVKFLINDDVFLTKKLDADGCHLGQKDMELAKAKNLLGYDPKVSFNDGIERFLDWHKHYENI